MIEGGTDSRGDEDSKAGSISVGGGASCGSDGGGGGGGGSGGGGSGGSGAGQLAGGSSGGGGGAAGRGRDVEGGSVGDSGSVGLGSFSVRVSVGLEASNRVERELVREHVEVINELLVAKGLPPHKESRVLREPLDFRCTRVEFPTSWFAYLQRLQAWHLLRPGMPPEPFVPSEDCEEAGEDPLIDDAHLAGIRSHLLCHSAEGYYIPQELEVPLFDVESELPGGWVGSSRGLLDELVTLSPYLDVNFRHSAGRVRRGGGFDISDETVATLNGYSPKDDFGVERVVWFALYEAARLSIKHGTVVVLKSLPG